MADPLLSTSLSHPQTTQGQKPIPRSLTFEADLDRTYVSSVERVERNIAVLNLAKLARALGVGASELLEEE